MDTYQRCLDYLMVLTPALSAEGWRPIETAPHDGTEVEIRVVHYLAAAFSEEPDCDGYIAVCRAHWINHNGGGFTWNGLAGMPSQWRPVTDAQGKG